MHWDLASNAVLPNTASIEQQSLNSFLLKCITLANSNIKVYTINGSAYTTQLQYSNLLTSKYADYDFFVAARLQLITQV